MPIRISRPSVQSLKVAPIARGNALAHATATIAKLPNGRPYLLTNRHVVTGRDIATGKCLDANAAVPDTLRVWFWGHDISHPHRIEVDIPLYTNGGPDGGGLPTWIEHPSYSTADVVALPLNVPDGVELMPYVHQWSC
jgi:hypothetical protein